MTGSRGPNREQSILVAPGTHRMESKKNGSGLYLSEVRITLRGSGGRDDTIIVMPADGPTLTIDDDTIENLTFRQDSGGSAAIIGTTGPYPYPGSGKVVQATIRNFVVDGRTTGEAVSIGGGAHESTLIENATIRNANGVALGIGGYPYDPSEVQDGKTTALPKAVVRGSTLSGKQTAVFVYGSAVPSVEDNDIGPTADGNGIYVIDQAAGLYRRNRISSTGSYAPLGSGGKAKPEFESNIVNTDGECVYAGEEATAYLRDNRFSGCFGGTARDSASLRLSGNDGLAEGDITVTGKARITTE